MSSTHSLELKRLPRPGWLLDIPDRGIHHEPLGKPNLFFLVAKIFVRHCLKWLSLFVIKLAHCCRGRGSETKTSVVSGLVKVSGRSCSVHGSGGGGRNRRVTDPFTTTRGTSNLSLGKAGCPGDHVREETDPKIQRGGRPGRSRLLPLGSGGESAREDAGVAPFIGTSGQSLLRRRKAEVIRLREPRVPIYDIGTIPFSAG